MKTFRAADQDTPQCPKRCRQVKKAFAVKQTQKEVAMHIEDTERLVTEIEMLKVVLHLVSRSRN